MYIFAITLSKKTDQRMLCFTCAKYCFTLKSFMMIYLTLAEDGEISTFSCKDDHTVKAFKKNWLLIDNISNLYDKEKTFFIF